jgi:hypothetical protein
MPAARAIVSYKIIIDFVLPVEFNRSRELVEKPGAMTSRSGRGSVPD